MANDIDPRYDVRIDGDTAHVTVTGGTFQVDADRLGEVLHGPKWFVYRHTRHGHREVRRRARRTDGTGTTELLHRFLRTNIAGQIDHEDGNPLNNRTENLRAATTRENHRNMGLTSANASGYKGVSFQQARGKWRALARIGEPGADGRARRVHLGMFTNPADAARAYDDAIRPVYGEYGRYNFPRPGEAGVHDFGA